MSIALSNKNTFKLPDMVRLPAGEFWMGESDYDKFANNTERPSHRVTIEAGVSMGSHPVTVGEYRDYDPKHAVDEWPALPVVSVTWHDAVAYCAWLSDETGITFRLPSEAEWEFACRAGSRTPFSFGNDITIADANFFYSESGERVGPGQRTAVGSYAANPLGLHDMHGQVCEWVADYWHANYNNAPDDGSAWMADGDPNLRVIRGGAWDYLPRLLRSSWRDGLSAFTSRDNVGFRIATSHSSIS